MKERSVFNYQREIERLRDLFGFDYIGIALVQLPECGFELRWTDVTGNRNERYQHLKFQSGKGLAGLVFKTGKEFGPFYNKEMVKDGSVQ